MERNRKEESKEKKRAEHINFSFHHSVSQCERAHDKYPKVLGKQGA